jgi:hypothetical protein
MATKMRKLNEPSELARRSPELEIKNIKQQKAEQKHGC